MVASNFFTSGQPLNTPRYPRAWCLCRAGKPSGNNPSGKHRGNKAGAPQPDLGFVITSCRFEEIGNLTAAATATPIFLTYGCTEVTLNASGGG
jgi:hypothetical protein